MPNRLSLKIFCAAILLAISAATGLAANQVESPDGKVAMIFQLQPGGFPAYQMEYEGKPVVLESRLGFEPDFTNTFEVVGAITTEHTGEWTNVIGERRILPDNYRELAVDLRNKSGRLLRIVFRAYNEGAALRYEFPGQATNEIILTGEHTEFRFPENTFGYEEHSTEGEYQRVNVADFHPWCERPLTLEYPGGYYAALGEAANQDYPRMLLSPLTGVPGALVSVLGGTTSNTESDRHRQSPDPTFRLRAGDSTPWRLFVVGEKPGDLLERNYLVLNLNPPTALKDISWIKPGKAMRDGTLTTTNSKAIIDFAATAGLQYVELDWHWYGNDETLETGDATTVRARNLDLPEIVRYGKEKNVGVILYVDHNQIKKQRDVLFSLYEKWGIAGVKIGFVDVGPQSETAWITGTIQKAAGHHLLLDIHDGYRSTGLERTYPNLLTVEGIRGNEHMPTAEHNCTLPFTRYIEGFGDYTVCYYNNRIQTTHAHQLAMAVVAFSPLQFVFWYDSPSNFKGEPEVEFFRHVPTVWDDTRVLNGEIGKFATIARRKGDDWFVGIINGGEPRTLKLPLTFLNPGRRYTAHIYSDDDSVSTRTHVGIETRVVDSTSVVELLLHPAGGAAVWIAPLSEILNQHHGQD
jgi:alpha-glucosidase